MRDAKRAAGAPRLAPKRCSRDNKKRSARPDTGCAELLHITVCSPSRSYSLPLGVKVDACLSVKVEVAENGLLVASERELRQGYRDRHVYSNLPCLNFVDELPRRATAAREDRGAIAILVGIDEGDCLVESIGLYATEHWAKDLLVVNLHAFLHLAEDSRPDEVAVLKATGDRGVPSIQKQRCALVNPRLDQALDPLFRLRRDHWANIHAFLSTGAYSHGGCFLSDPWDPPPRGTDKDCHAKGHAA